MRICQMTEKKTVPYCYKHSSKEQVSALIFHNAHSLLWNGYMRCDTNKLKKNACVNIKQRKSIALRNGQGMNKLTWLGATT